MTEHVHKWKIMWNEGYVQCTVEGRKRWMAYRKAEARLNATEKLSAENSTLKREGDFLRLVGSNKDRLKCAICLKQIWEADYEYDGTFPHKPDCLLADILEGTQNMPIFQETGKFLKPKEGK